MNDKAAKQPSDQADSNEQREPNQHPEHQSDIVDVMDLVYKGGYDRDPQEILGNPAVAPPMLNEGRDLRSDIFHEAEETIPKQSEDTSDDQGSVSG